MSFGIWLVSFVYLAAVVSWVCVGVSEPDDKQALRHALVFFTKTVVGIGGFAVLVSFAELALR